MKILPVMLLIIPFLSVSMGSAASVKIKTLHPELKVNTSSMISTVEYLSNIRPYRNFLSPGTLKTIALYIKKHFSSYGISTDVQIFEVKGDEYLNIIGTINPDKPSRIIIGAHYDVCGYQPGADDNASGIAALLEIARLTKNYASKLNYRIDFVAYSLEEPPFFRTDKMGSYIHAKSIHDSGADVKGMICLESIGFFTSEKKTQKYPIWFMNLFYPKEGNFIGIVGNFQSSGLVNEVKRHMNATSIETRSIKAPSIVTGVDFSDHRNYWKFGYDAVMITDTAFFRNPNYHKITDTIDTLDFNKMKEIVECVVWTLINTK